MFQRLNVIVLLLLALTGCAGGGAGSTAAAAGSPGAAPSSPADPGLAPSAAGTDAGRAGATGGTAILPVGSTAAASEGTDLGGEGSGPAMSAPPATAAEEGAGDDGPTVDLPGLVLEAGGLGVISADTHIAHLEFGTSARRVRATVARLVGRLVAHRQACPGGRRTVYTTRGFTIVARGDHFVGWTDRGAPGRTLSTVDGIAVGLTVAQLQGSATQVTVHTVHPAGATWTSGKRGLSGRATSPSADGLVTVVSSGEAC